MESVLLRCHSCGSANRVLVNKLGSGPKCGKCGTTLTYPQQPVDVSSQSFEREVVSTPGAVLVEFWTPT